jgi:hypothetical protein
VQDIGSDSVKKTCSHNHDPIVNLLLLDGSRFFSMRPDKLTGFVVDLIKGWHGVDSSVSIT